VASPIVVPAGFEQAFVDHLEHDHWRVNWITCDSDEDPLRWLTERLYLEPEQWVGWSVETMFTQLSPRQVVAIDGVTDSNWDAWRAFLRDFEVASRRRASDERAVLLVFAKGVSRRRLQLSGAALQLMEWSGVIRELDTMTFADQRLRGRRRPPRHHKLVVRQIAALALWDLDLAGYLAEQPEGDMFEIEAVLQAAKRSLGRDGSSMSASWEQGGLDVFDGLELVHPFLLVEQGDREGELKRRLWAAQAAELLPLIEVRRRELVKSLERHVTCPFWIDGKNKVGGQAPVQVMVRSLDELEIGSLAYVTETQRVRDDLRDRAKWLASCRNTLAHLGVLNGKDALDARLHGPAG
jgi:hypothetical protein